MISIFSGGNQIGFFIIILVLFLAAGFRAAEGIREWRANNRKEVLSDRALLVSKERTRLKGHAAAENSSIKIPEASVTWTLVFASEDHGTISLEVTDREGRLLKENTRGILTWQGSRYISFVPSLHE